MPVVSRWMTARAETVMVVVAEDPHEERRRAWRAVERVTKRMVSSSSNSHRLDADRVVARAEVGVEELLRHLLGVGVERDAAGGEAGGVERLAHAGLEQVAERGVDGEPDRADQRDQRHREEHRGHAAPVAQDRAEEGIERPRCCASIQITPLPIEPPIAA